MLTDRLIPLGLSVTEDSEKIIIIVVAVVAVIIIIIIIIIIVVIIIIIIKFSFNQNKRMTCPLGWSERHGKEIKIGIVIS